MEPCCHYGKTPPCVDAVIKSGFKRVVIGSLDPNPVVSGKSVAMMRQQGIEVITGIMEEKCHALNEAHFKYMATGTPLVTLKFAQTLDGRIAAVSGSSQWISSEASRKIAHRLRSANDAVLVGISTVLADNPELTVRLSRGRNPLRVVLDSSLRVPLDSRVLGKEANTIIVTTCRSDEAKATQLRAQGVEVLAVTAGKGGGIDLTELLGELGQRGITSVLVEGGSAVITSFLREGLADRMVVFVAPAIMGKGIEAVGDLKIEEASGALPITFTRIYRAGDDLVIEAKTGI
jgi:diaminohydroxyphosphoribosylaminopyrimidine deaminase/5-amino-6-(5-phosphoribosylamino)uracil reductase